MAEFNPDPVKGKTETSFDDADTLVWETPDFWEVDILNQTQGGASISNDGGGYS